MGLQVLTNPRLLAGLLVGKSELKSRVTRVPANGAVMSCGVSKRSELLQLLEASDVVEYSTPIIFLGVEMYCVTTVQWHSGSRQEHSKIQSTSIQGEGRVCILTYVLFLPLQLPYWPTTCAQSTWPYCIMCKAVFASIGIESPTAVRCHQHPLPPLVASCILHLASWSRTS